MAWHWREDRGTLLSPQRRGNELLVEGMVAKAGILTYKNADGTETRELVTWEVLRDSAEGLGRAPVTLEHPDDDVTPDNYAELGVGDVDGRIKVHEDTGFVQVQIAIRRRDAWDAVEHGTKVELSPGYHAQVDPTPGVHEEFGPYDAIQTSRRYNHLAIVETARGGSSIRIRTDSASAARAVDVIASPPPPDRGRPALPTPTPGAPMRLTAGVIQLCGRLRLDHRRFDSDEEALKAIDAEVAANQSDTAPPPPAAPSQDMQPPPEQLDSEETDDAMSEYTDADGRHLTKDEALKAQGDYIKKLEDALLEMQDQSAKADMEPLAKDMGLEVQKGDSAFDLAVRIAEAHLGRALTDVQRQDSSFVGGIVESALARRDAANADTPDAGRLAGNAAWGPMTAPANANSTRHDAASTGPKSLGDIALENWTNDFSTVRGGTP